MPTSTGPPPPMPPPPVSFAFLPGDRVRTRTNKSSSGICAASWTAPAAIVIASMIDMAGRKWSEISYKSGEGITRCLWVPQSSLEPFANSEAAVNPEKEAEAFVSEPTT